MLSGGTGHAPGTWYVRASGSRIVSKPHTTP
jgi:hypothetical protein